MVKTDTVGTRLGDINKFMHLNELVIDKSNNKQQVKGRLLGNGAEKTRYSHIEVPYKWET